MKNTQNYNLNKPDGNDYAKIESLNENADIIDAELKRITSAIGNGSTGNDILSRLNELETKVGNLNNLETAQKANLVAAINEVRQSAINAWQKDTYNNSRIINLGTKKAIKTFTVNQADWKNTGNVELLDIVVPFRGAFSGSIKVNYSVMWGTSGSWGSTGVVYNIGSFVPETKLNEFTIVTASSAMMRDFKVGKPYIDNTTGDIAIQLYRAPTANNPLEITVELDGTYSSSTHNSNLFNTLKGSYITTTDLGSTTAGGYPWTPQSSQIPTYDAIGRWDGTFSRIMPYCRTISDWNNQTDNGFYMTEPSANTYAPDSTSWWMGIVIKHDVAYVVQKVNCVTDDREFQRRMHGSIWGPWVETSPMTLFKSVSEGKADNRAALAQKGVQIPQDPTFAQISQGILQIQTGKKTDRGTINIPALAAGATTSVNMVVYFKPGTVLLNLDGRFLLDGVLQGNDWANRHSVYDIRVVPYDSTNWMVTFFIRGGQFGAGQQYNYALFIE